jgi:hypothetical protein
MLSPSIEQDKLIAGIKQSISKEADRQSFNDSVGINPARLLFKKRIIGIKQEHIIDVKIDNSALVEKLFLHDSNKAIKPRQQRDIKKVICLIKGFALFNVWFRKREGDYIYAIDSDIYEAFELWNSISVGQDYGLAPYIYQIYANVIVPLWKKQEMENYNSPLDFAKKGLKRQDILNKYNKLHGAPLSIIYLRQHILPQLEQVGLIVQERSTDDGRQMLVFPQELEIETTNNSVVGSGVNSSNDIENNSVEEGGVNQGIIKL